MSSRASWCGRERIARGLGRRTGRRRTARRENGARNEHGDGMTTHSKRVAAGPRRSRAMHVTTPLPRRWSRHRDPHCPGSRSRGCRYPRRYWACAPTLMAAFGQARARQVSNARLSRRSIRASAFFTTFAATLARATSVRPISAGRSTHSTAAPGGSASSDLPASLGVVPPQGARLLRHVDLVRYGVAMVSGPGRSVQPGCL